MLSECAISNEPKEIYSGQLTPSIYVTDGKVNGASSMLKSVLR